MSGPRNRRAAERSARLRAEIRTLLAQHPPLLPPLSAKEIRANLRGGSTPSLRTVQWHISAIRLEAELAMLSAPDTLRTAQFIK